MRRISDEQILEAGVRTFGDRGFHDSSMVDVATEAGVTKPTVYARFADKATLLEASLARERDLLLEHLFATYESSRTQPLAGQITVDVEALFSYAGARPHGFRLLFGDHASEQVIAVRRDVVDRLETRIAELVLRYAAAPRRRARPVAVSTAGARLLASLIVATSIRGASEATRADDVRAAALCRATATYVLSALRDVDLGGL